MRAALLILAVLVLAGFVTAAALGATLAAAGSLAGLTLLAAAQHFAGRRPARGPASRVQCGLCDKLVKIQTGDMITELERHWDTDCPYILIAEAEELAARGDGGAA